MEINIPSNVFIELNNLFKVSTVDIEVSDYQLQDSEIIANIRISGDYYQNDFDSTLCEFEKTIPVNIVLNERNNQVDEVEINNFEYFEVEKRGIETSFSVDILTSEVKVNEELEKIKESITQEVDDELSEILEIVEDNLPQKVKKARNRENYQSIRICFFKNDQELNKILSDNNKDDVLLDRLNENYLEKSRIII